ncbi:MAG: glycosyltransferase family 39 protein [Candidatus Dojkabacteria bacterium]|nr:MAG: glycosyltransferase family 39 protein [Candidatus Dojkabacteria bacterium]
MNSKAPKNSDRLKNAFFVWILPVFLALLYFIIASTAIHGKSMTQDEKYHITRGIILLETGDLRLNIHHPYIANVLNALPLYLFEDVELPSENSLAWQEGNKDLFTDELMQANGGELEFASQYIFQARLVSIFITSIFIFFFYTFIRRCWGITEAVISTILLAFSPTFLAHGALATTDIFSAITIFMATAALWRYMVTDLDEKVSRRWALALFILASFLALMSKYSAVPLALLWLLILWLDGIKRYAASFGTYAKTNNTRWRTFIHSVAQSSFIVLLVAVSWVGLMFMAYRLEFGTMQQTVLYQDNSSFDTNYQVDKDSLIFADQLQYIFEEVQLPFPHYFRGFMENVILHNVNQHETFFIGQYKDIPPTYHLGAFLLKEPVITVAFSIFSITILGYYGVLSALNHINARKESVVRHRIPVAFPILFALVPAFIFITISFSSIKLGIRHIAPVLPFIYMASGVVVAYYFRRQIVARVLVIVALALIALDILFAYPEYVNYFSTAIGGDRNGYKYLHDSNLDWGQNEFMVEEYIDEHPAYDAQYRPGTIERGRYYVISVSELFGDPLYVPRYALELHEMYDSGELKLVDWISNTHWVVYTE